MFARFSSSFLTWQLVPPRPQVIRDVISVHMEELSGHWQEEQEKDADGADRCVLVSSWERSSAESVTGHCPAGFWHSSDHSQHTDLPGGSSSSCHHSCKTYSAELCFFACPLTGVQDDACLFGLCYRMLGSRLVCRGDQWLKLADDLSFCLRSEERRSASVDSRQSGGSHLDGECSWRRRDRSRSPHKRKRNKDKDRSWDSRKRKER